MNSVFEEFTFRQPACIQCWILASVLNMFILYTWIGNEVLNEYVWQFMTFPNSRRKSHSPWIRNSKPQSKFTCACLPSDRVHSGMFGNTHTSKTYKRNKIIFFTCFANGYMFSQSTYKYNYAKLCNKNHLTNFLLEIICFKKSSLTPAWTPIDEGNSSCKLHLFLCMRFICIIEVQVLV